MKTISTNDYSRLFSERNLWDKILKCAIAAGREVIKLVLILYYELSDKNISLAEKGVIIGALGYFIAPLDIIPDSIPVVGYADDLAALKAAYHFISSHITPEIRQKAESKLNDWFGSKQISVA